MARIEQWMKDVFPGEQRIYAEYRLLPARELAIVAAAVLDVALAEIISLRLRQNRKEIELFLGIDGDGRTPAGSFGARIQLALLVGLITEEDATILRQIKNLRNTFAHRVKVDFLSPSVQKITKEMHSAWVKRTTGLEGLEKNTDGLAFIEKHLSTIPEAGEGLLLALLAIYQAYFHRLHDRIRPLNDLVADKD